MAVPSVTHTFSNVDTSATATITLTVAGGAIPAGSVLFISAGRSTATGNSNGVASITGQGAGNTWSLHDAAANRASTIDTTLHRCVVVNQIANGTVLTITFNSASGARKLAVGHVVSGLTGTKDTSCQTTVGLGETSIGPNGSSATPAATTTAVSSGTPRFVFGAIGFGSAGGTMTGASGSTVGTQVTTAAGSGDRALATLYRTDTGAVATEAVNGSMTSTGWSGVVATYPITAPSTPTGLGTTPASTQITLTWSAVSGATGYNVRLNGGAPTDVGNVLTHDFTGLTPSTLYTLEVQAYDSLQSSSFASTTDTTTAGGGGGTTGSYGDTLVYSLNRIAGTLVNGLPTLEDAGAANVYAGTTGLSLVGALNVAAGNARASYRELQGVLNQLAGTTGLGPAEAARLIEA